MQSCSVPTVRGATTADTTAVVHVTHSGPEVLFKTCVAMKFVDDDEKWSGTKVLVPRRGHLHPAPRPRAGLGVECERGAPLPL